MKKYKYIKYFTVDGHRYVVRADTMDQLYEKMAAKKQEIRDGGKLVSGSMTVSEWAYQCVDTYKVNQADSTREVFVARMESTILNDIGHMKIKSVRPIHCQKILNKQSGNSRQYIAIIHQTLKFIFAKAVDNNLIRKSPAENLERPTGYTHHYRALRASERAVISKLVLEDRRYYVFALMLFCGCRPTEASNIHRYDIKEKDGIPILHIRGTKTKSADRYVPVPDALWAVIKDLPDNEPVSLTPRGKPHNLNTRKGAWKILINRANIEAGCAEYKGQAIPPYRIGDDLVQYCLRHEFCTELARQQVDIRIAQKLMGHSDVKMTANIYTNLEEEDIVGVARDLPGVAEGVAEEPGKTGKNRKNDKSGNVLSSL